MNGLFKCCTTTLSTLSTSTETEKTILIINKNRSLNC